MEKSYEKKVLSKKWFKSRVRAENTITISFLGYCVAFDSSIKDR